MKALETTRETMDTAKDNRGGIEGGISEKFSYLKNICE